MWNTKGIHSCYHYLWNSYKSMHFSVLGYRYEEDNAPMFGEYSLNLQRHIKYYVKEWNEENVGIEQGQGKYVHLKLVKEGLITKKSREIRYFFRKT